MTTRTIALASLLLALPAPAPPDTGQRVVLEELDGTTIERDLETFAIEGPRELEAVLVRFEGGARSEVAPPPGERAEVTLASGDRLVVGRLAGSGEELRFELAGGVPLALSIEELASVVLPARLPETPGAPLAPAPEGDRLYVRTGEVLDRIDGAVEAFTLEGVRFDSVVGTRLYDWDAVAALFVEHEAPDERPTGAPGEPGDPDRLPVVIDLLDGGRLRGGFRKLDALGCALDLGGGREVLVPARALAEIAVDDGRIAFLSDLEPSAASEGSPFDDELGLVWKHRVDRAVDGGPLRAGGRTFTRGVGVHSPSRLTWELGGAWKELRGLVAIDDQVARLTARGSVVFRVLVDGEPRWESAVLRGGDAPQAIPPIDLTDALTLDLEVDMATEFHMGDRADWLRVILVR